MRIAVNTRFLLPGKLEGFGVFTHETMKRITRNHPEHEFVFLFDRPYDKAFIYSDNIIPEVVFPPARHPLLWYWWFEWSLPRLLKKYDPDLFLSPDGYLSLNAKVKSIPVIHDLAFEHYPKAIPRSGLMYYKHFFPKYARKADRIATVSRYSKDDIVNHYRIDPDKIDVVYNGANEVFQPLTRDQKSMIQRELTNGVPYFAYVGALHQRKNITHLLHAFDLFKQITDSSVKLVIIGRKAWGNKEMEAIYQGMEHGRDVIFTGSVTQEKLAEYLGATEALAYLSLFEGFGIPLVEAMYCDVPVITSDRTSLPEVAGDAAIICNPLKSVEIADAMALIINDERYRQKLIEKGRQQRKKFSWQQTAERLWDVIEKSANS